MGRIVVVDDAPEVLKLISHHLQAANHEVITYQSGAGLEERLAQDQPDVLLLDIVLPERDGFQILRSIKKQEATRGLPVVLVSSKTEETDVEWGKLQGADEYLKKPFTAEELLATVGRYAR